MAGAALATNQLLITEERDLALNQALEILGCSANVDRVFIYENYDTEDGEHCCKLKYDWNREDLDVRPTGEDSDLSYSHPINWYDALADGMPLKGLAADLPGPARMLLQKMNVLSYLLVPIFTKEGFWGFIGFDDRKNMRIWTWGEVSVLMTIAGAIGGSMNRWKTQDALMESEKKYRELVESASSIIMRIDTQGNITFLNRFALDFFGYQPEDILGKNVMDSIMPTVDSEGLDTKIMQALSGSLRDRSTSVFENMRSNGERVWIAWTSHPVLNDAGEIKEILCIGNDLTEARCSREKLKRAAEELRETRDYLESLIGHANAPIIVWDPGFHITRFNHAFERLTGHEAASVLGRRLEMLFPKESRDASMAYIEKTLTGELWDSVEIPILRKDGDIRTVLWNSASIYDREGKEVVATIAQGQDITERNKAEGQVAFQASLLDQVKNAVIATDLSGRIIYWNRFSETLYQWKAEDVLGKSIAETIVPAGYVSLINDVMQSVLRCGYREGEYMVARRDGSIFPALYVYSILRDELGRQMGIVGVSSDLTERKKEEQYLLFAKERAESATKAKSEFLANMSHEIRTPMNAVIGLTDLLLKTDIDSEQRDYIETIRSSGDSLLAVISDILDFSKIEGGMLDLERMPFNLRQCLEKSVNMVAEAAAKKSILLRLDIAPNTPDRIKGDAIRLQQILVNLLGNAVKFTDAGQVSVNVSLCPDTDSSAQPFRGDGREMEIQFAVEDTGIGISKDLMGRLFQSFSQVDASTTRKYGGTGLGLVISKNLAEMMGGKIWAESEPGRGSTFYFTIKAVAASDEERQAPSREKTDTTQQSHPVSGPAAQKTDRSKKGLWILLVEDNAVNQKVAMRILQKLGYRADIAGNGQQALQALRNYPYDVVLMDVQMPEMDGLEATRIIRSHPGRQPYIIAMTAHAMKGDREECLASGMDDYISKPVRIEDLCKAIERSLPAIIRKEPKEEAEERA